MLRNLDSMSQIVTMEYLYVVECQSGKYYVGKSSDPVCILQWIVHDTLQLALTNIVLYPSLIEVQNLPVSAGSASLASLPRARL